MDLAKLIGAGLVIALGAGATAAWFKRGEGQSSLQLAQSTIDLYKARETELQRQIIELQASNKQKDKTIMELRNTIKTLVREFKEYKNGTH